MNMCQRCGTMPSKGIKHVCDNEGFYEKLWKDFVSLQRGKAVTMSMQIESLRRILAVARMVNNREPDIRMTHALRDWDKLQSGETLPKNE